MPTSKWSREALTTRDIESPHRAVQLKKLRSGSGKRISKARDLSSPKADTPRSYWVDTPTTKLRRNLRHLMIVPDQAVPSAASCDPVASHAATSSLVSSNLATHTSGTTRCPMMTRSGPIPRFTLRKDFVFRKGHVAYTLMHSLFTTLYYVLCTIFLLSKTVCAYCTEQCPTPMLYNAGPFLFPWLV